jgi:Single-strand binding protein family
MSYLNSVTIVGFVGADPEQRQARNNGSKFTVLSVATQRSWKNAEDEWVSKVEWHRVAIIWNQSSCQIWPGTLDSREVTDRTQPGSCSTASERLACSLRCGLSCAH